jgi:hypothetical protein
MAVKFNEKQGTIFLVIKWRYQADEDVTAELDRVK